MRVAGSIRARPAHGAGGGVPLGEPGVGDPVPVVLPIEVPAVVLDVVAPCDVVEVGCVVEVESLGDWLVPVVVELADVDDPVPVVLAGEPSPGSVVAAAPLRVARPPPIVIEVPPVAGVLLFVGTVIVTVEVVSVVSGIAFVELAGATRARCGAGAADTIGAAGSGCTALEYVGAGAAGGGAWWVGGATSAARAW